MNKHLVPLFLFFFLSLALWAQTPTQGNAAMTTPKILVAYFSHSGNTRVIAQLIQKQTGGTLFEIQAAKPYPQDYDEVVAVAKKEKAANARPVLKNHLSNVQEYDVIFLGFPNWWGSFPMAVATFLEENDLAGKIVIPFCTHEGSYMGSSESDLAKLEPKAIRLEGLPIRGRSVKDAQVEVSEWIKKLAVVKK